MPSTNVGAEDVDELYIFFGPRRVQGWPSSGTVASVAPVNPTKVALTEGIDAEVSITKRRGSAHTVELTVMRTALIVSFFDQHLKAQENAPGLVFLPLSWVHRGTKLFAPRAYIEGQPTLSFSDGSETLTYRFVCPFLDGPRAGLTVD